MEKDNGSYRKVALSNDISKSVLNRNLKKSQENPEGLVSYKIQADENISITPTTQQNRLNYSHANLNKSFDKTLFIITFQANVILANQGAITIASSQGGDPSHYRAFQTRSDFVTPKANYPQDASFHVYYVIRKQ